MTNVIVADAEALLAKIKAEFAPEVKATENAVKAIVHDSVDYIETNGLQDVYQMALTLVTGMAGTPWAQVLAALETQAVAAGKTLVAGAFDIVANMAKADLVAAGKLIPTAPATA